MKKIKSKKRCVGRPRIPMITEDLGAVGDKLPARPIVLEQVLYWMDVGGSAEEIAGSFRVSVDTLDRRLREFVGLNFAELKIKTCGAAKLKLRNNQFKMSATNAAMGIWLGKNWLGQKDKHDEQEITANLTMLLKLALQGKINQEVVDDITKDPTDS